MEIFKRALLFVVLLSFLSSCDWDNWRTFKSSCEDDYDATVTLSIKDGRGRLSFLKKQLMRTDVLLLAGKEPSRSLEGGEFLCEEYHFRRLPLDKAQGSDMSIFCYYDKAGFLKHWEFPSLYVQHCQDEKTIQATVKSLAQGGFNVFTSKLSNDIDLNDEKYYKRASYVELKKVYGEANKDELDDDERELTYSYWIAPAEGEGGSLSEALRNKGRQVTMVFSLDENSLLRTMSLELGSVSLVLELED